MFIIIVGHLWVSKSAGLAVKIAIPMQIPCKSPCFAVAKGEMVVKSHPRNMSETYYQGTNDIWSGKSQAIILKSPPNKLYFAKFSVKPTPLTTESGSEQILTYTISNIWLKESLMIPFRSSELILGICVCQNQLVWQSKSLLPCKSYANPHVLRWPRVKW